MYKTWDISIKSSPPPLTPFLVIQSRMRRMSQTVIHWVLIVPGFLTPIPLFPPFTTSPPLPLRTAAPPTPPPALLVSPSSAPLRLHPPPLPPLIFLNLSFHQPCHFTCPTLTAPPNSPDLALIASGHRARFSLSSCDEREHVGSVSKRCVTGRAEGEQRQRRPASDEPPSLSRELKSFGSEPKCAEPKSILISGISFHFKGRRNLA